MLTFLTCPAYLSMLDKCPLQEPNSNTIEIKSRSIFDSNLVIHCFKYCRTALTALTALTTLAATLCSFLSVISINS